MLSEVLIEFLALCRSDLEDLELDKRQYYLLSVNPTEDELSALKIFKEVNSIVFGKLIAN